MNYSPGEFGGQSTVAVTTVPHYQPPTVITAGIPKTIKSCPLIGFGIVLFLLSAAHVGLSAWILSLVNNAVFAHVSLACGLAFLLQSFLSTYGGCDVARRQYAIIWCMVLGILGVIVALVTAVINFATLQDYPEQCQICDFKFNHSETSLGFSGDCSEMCYIAYGPIHVGLAVIAVLEGLTGFILSISSCCNTCSCCCCYEDPFPSGYVLQSPVTASHYIISSTPYMPLVNPPEPLPC